MSQQIQISGGAKVRDLQDVIIGTSGVLSSLAFNVANGVPKLDVNGKILVSQLPNSVMEYKGVWNAATNTPTLANGTGNQGDVYLCNVAGTTNFGAGPIAFVVGDQVIYSSVAEGSIWQRASGATGTVTSVALTESGDSLNITGSPITTSGTINIGFNGTNLQYVNGAGNLTTFPTLITSIGLSMPSAFSVANSPLTANGTIAVTGAGTTAQYIRGDGSLATFPTIATEAQRLITEVYNETGATLSKGTVVYINGGHGNLPTITKALATGDATSAQTYGIVQTDITNMNNGYVVVIGSLTDLDTSAYVEGTQLYLSSTTAGAWTSVKQYAPAHLVYVAIVTRSHPTQGVVEVMIQNGFEMDELHNVSAQSPLNNQGLFYNTSTSLWENKSIATALGYTPISLTSLSASSPLSYNNTTGAFSIQVANTSQNGYLSSTDWNTFNSKENNLTFYSPLVKSGSSVTIPPATSIANGYLTSTDWSTFNSKQAALSGTGFVKISGTTISYDNSTYYLASNPSAFIALTALSAGAGISYNNTTGVITNSAPDQTVSLTAGAGISVTGTYPSFTIASIITQYTDALARAALSFAAGSGAYNSTTGVITIPTNNNQITNGAGYITGNQTITLSGDVSGSGTTAITTTIGALKVTNAMLAGSIDLTTKVTGLLPDGNISSAATWNAKQNAITLTTTGTSGAATLVGATLNIPQYTDTYTGTVTSVAALTIGTSGTDLSSSVANSTTTPVITLNVPTASATNRGALSSADWTTFNNKQGTITLTTTGTSGAATLVGATLNIPQYQSVLTNPVTGTGSTNRVPKFTGASTIGNSIVFDNGDNVSFGSAASTRIAITDTAVINSYYAAETLPRYVINRDLLGGGLAGIGFTDREATLATWGVAVGLSAARELGFFVSNGTSLVKYANINSSGAFTINKGDGNDALKIYGSGASSYLFFKSTASYATLGSYTSGAGYIPIYIEASPLLVGTTTDAGYKLDVNGTGRFSGDLSVKNATTHAYLNIDAAASGASEAGLMLRVGGTNKWEMYTANNDGNLSFWSAGQGIKFKIEPTGAATFSSSVTAGTYLGVAKDGSDTIGAGAYLVLAATSSSRQWIQQLSASQNLTYYHYNGSSWIQPVTFTAGGNVLIGTTTEGVERLRVNGRALITDSAQVPLTLNNTGQRYTQFDLHNNGVQKGAIWIDNTDASFNFYATSGWSQIFSTNATERMRITSGGNVGIGTSSPSEKLEVQDGYLSTYHNLNANGAGYGVQFYTNGGGSKNSLANIIISQIGTTRSADMIFNISNGGAPAERVRVTTAGVVLTYDGQDQFVIRNATDNNRQILMGYVYSGNYARFQAVQQGVAYRNIVLNSDGGNVLVGTTTDGGYKLYIGGSVGATGGFFEASDKRLKKELSDNPIIENIAQIKPKKYVKDGKEELGYYAQDLQEVLPSAVSEGKDGFLALSYTQVHTAKIAQLEGELSELKQIVKNLMNELGRNSK